jgi:molecular chaperone GrpE (heat shock protein)
MSDELNNLSKDISDAAVVRQFTESEIGKRVFASLGRRYYDEFKAAQTPAEREMAHAKAKVADDLAVTLIAVLDNGQVAQAKQAQHDRLNPAKRNLRSL